MLNPDSSPSTAGCSSNANPAVPVPYDIDYSSVEAMVWEALMRLGVPGKSVLNPIVPLVLEVVPATSDEQKVPDAPPAIIEGLVRQKGKLLITGAPKTWKSFLAIQLVIACATGGEWLGFPCAKGRVLYVNLEIDDIQFRKRVARIANAMNADEDELSQNLQLASRPRAGYDADSLIEGIIRSACKGFDLVIIDPIYMLLPGDENASLTMRDFCSCIDRLSEELGCAVAMVHHQSKGEQRNKPVIERACGSGVIGRYVDAFVSVGRLQSEENAMRAEFCLRDFEEPAPVDYRFNYPLCEVDATGALAKCRYGSAKPGRQSCAARLKEIEAACDKLLQGREYINRHELIEELGGHINGETINKYLNNSERFKYESGCNWCHVMRR